MNYVATEDGHVFVEIEGEAGELVLIATGGPGASHDHYHPWFSALLPEFRVGYVDYVGCGLSARLDDPEAYSVSGRTSHLHRRVARGSRIHGCGCGTHPVAPV